MAKVTVVLSKPVNIEEFDNYYFNVHVPLVENLPDVKNISVGKVFEAHNFGNEPYIVAQFEFDNKQLMDKSLASEQGNKLYGDVENLMKYLPSPPMMTFSE